MFFRRVAASSNQALELTAGSWPRRFSARPLADATQLFVRLEKRIAKMSDKLKNEDYDIDVKCPSEELVDLIGFRTKSRNRIEDYLKSQGIGKLSLRNLMDLFLPPASSACKTDQEFWANIPILKQPQFGPYLYNSALLSLSEAKVGTAFRKEWMLRVYSLKLHELKNCPANKWRRQTAKAEAVEPWRSLRKGNQ